MLKHVKIMMRIVLHKTIKRSELRDHHTPYVKILPQDLCSIPAQKRFAEFLINAFRRNAFQELPLRMQSLCSTLFHGKPQNRSKP